ncbi:16S rRNA (adenine(1518)-N(6)/adenine(1519)-N(6))-dimethyltransferase RsmA [Bacteroidota bacterium]
MSLRPIKRLGQHFLVDPNTIRRIITQLEAPADARVVEIGPGPGALTDYLVKQYADLVTIEVDERAVELLHERHPGLDVRHMDILDVDYSEIGIGAAGQTVGARSLWVIGNLPYNITSQILFGLLEAPEIVRAVLTMQKEVAERLVAQPRTKAYGILSVLTQLFARPKICFHISPNVFRPKPDVWSSTVRLDFPSEISLQHAVDRMHLRAVVRTAFNQRRKTLRNSLRQLASEAGGEVPEEWAGKRAEELAPHEFVSLTRFIYKIR